MHNYPIYLQDKCHICLQVKYRQMWQTYLNHIWTAFVWHQICFFAQWYISKHHRNQKRRVQAEYSCAWYKAQKKLIVFLANAVVDPRTVVVKAADAWVANSWKKLKTEKRQFSCNGEATYLIFKFNLIILQDQKCWKCDEWRPHITSLVAYSISRGISCGWHRFICFSEIIITVMRSPENDPLLTYTQVRHTKVQVRENRPFRGQFFYASRRSLRPIIKGFGYCTSFCFEIFC